MADPDGTRENPFPIDPDEYFDYKADFAATTNGSDTTQDDALANGETLTASYTLTAQTGLVVDNDSRTDTNTSITFWVNPAATASGLLYVEVNAPTSAGRVFDRKVYWYVSDR